MQIAPSTPDLDSSQPEQAQQSMQPQARTLTRLRGRRTVPLMALAVITTVAIGWGLFAMIDALLAILAGGAGTAGQHSHWLTGGPLTRTITDGVHTYLDAHAAGLPATAAQLWTAWLIVTGGLWASAVLGGRGARIGWTLLGMLSTAMVFAGTTPASQHLAAGLTVAVWAVLSVPALRRTHPSYPTVINQIPPAAPTSTEAPQS